jgi:hypothetical protein
MKVLSGMLLYVSIQEPVAAYVKPGLPPKPREWKSSVVITDKAVKKEYEKFAKSLDTLVSIKEVETSEFKDIYKVDPPEDAGDELWVVTLRKSTELGKTGKPVPDAFRPRVYEQVGNSRVDITHTKLVGNGSYGKIALDIFMKTAGGGSIGLKSVLVTDLIEYERKDSVSNDGSEFDADDGSDTPVKVPAKAIEKAQSAAKAKPKAKPVDDFDDSDPF